MHACRDGGDRRLLEAGLAHLSDGDVTLVLANAGHVKNVPGRKTDVNDATWLADLMAHGLIRGSFVPDAQTQELRALLRTRKQFVRERSSHVQLLQKTLEDANIKLDSVISDIIGRSGRAMLAALIAGESDPEDAVEDVLKTFAADRILIFTHGGDEQRYKEDVDTDALESRFGIPVSQSEI